MVSTTASARYDIPMDACPDDKSLTRKYSSEWTSGVKDMDSGKYDCAVRQLSYGKCLVAMKDLPAGSIVEKFEGPDVSFDECTDYDKRYVLLYQKIAKCSEWHYMLPLSPARYANHACEPNCIIDDSLQIVTAKDVKRGQELNYIYNKGQETDDWDPIWNFECMCGSPNCQGMVDRYRDVMEPQLPDHLRVKSKAQAESHV